MANIAINQAKPLGSVQNNTQSLQKKTSSNNKNTLTIHQPEDNYLIGPSLSEMKNQINWEKIKTENSDRKIKLTDIFNPIKLLNKVLKKIFYPGTFQKHPSSYIASAPSNLDQFRKLGANIKSEYILTGNKTPILVWHIRQADKSDAKTKLYFHGNAGSVNDFSKNALKDFIAGSNIVLTSYGGYSANPGSPSQANLTEDSRSIISYLIDQEGVKSEGLNIIAHSLGSAVALAGLEKRSQEKNPEYYKLLEDLENLAKSNPEELQKLMTDPEKLRSKISDSIKERYGNLTLISPFSKFIDLLKNKLKIISKPLLSKVFKTELWDNPDKVIKLSRLINFLEIKHGEKDTLIPIKHAEDLHQSARQASIPIYFNKISAAGHNDILNDSYEAELLSLPIDKNLNPSQMSSPTSHMKETGQEFAIDLFSPQLQIGSPIYACEGGIVLDDLVTGSGVIDNNIDRPEGDFSFNPSEEMKINRLFIQTPTGKIDLYAHLKQGSTKLKPGDKVKKGEKVGEVGNNGASDGLHLHFARGDKDPSKVFKFNSIPIKFG